MSDLLTQWLGGPRKAKPTGPPGQPTGPEPLGQSGPAALSTGDPKVLRRDPKEAPPEVSREIEPLLVDWARPMPVVITKVITIRDVPLEEWSTSRAAVTDIPVQVVGSGHHRKKAKVRNAGGAAVFVGPTRSTDLLRAQGFELPPGDSIDFGHVDAVYGVCNSGQSSRCDVVQEFERHPDKAR